MCIFLSFFNLFQQKLVKMIFQLKSLFEIKLKNGELIRGSSGLLSTSLSLSPSFLIYSKVIKVESLIKYSTALSFSPTYISASGTARC